MNAPDDTTRLAQIRDRSERLAAIPMETSASNYVMRDMIDSIGDVRWLLEQVERQRAERQGALVWEEWCVRILISGGAVSMDYEDETDAQIRYRELLDHPEKVRRLVSDATSYPGKIGAVELLCRTNWQGDYRVVESTPQQPASDGGDRG